MPELEPIQPAGDDPIAHLHKMSTTAGVGSQEYVEINKFSVTAALLGLASPLAFVVSLLLVLPAAGVVTGIVALRQIANSSGTQTGRAMAWVGIVLSLLLGGAFAGLRIHEAMSAAPDRRMINEVIRQVGQDVTAGNYQAAYQRFHPVFRQIFPLPMFEDRWRAQQSQPGLGKLQSMEGNGVIEMKEVGQTVMARTMALIRFEGQKEPDRFVIVLEKSGGQWQIRTMEDLFPVKQGSRSRTPQIGP